MNNVHEAIISNHREKARKPAKTPSASASKVYRKHMRHNRDIIRYMLSKGATIKEIAAEVKYSNLSKRLKSSPLSPDQAEAVLSAIDRIAARKEKEPEKGNIWRE